jgi:hypothetical protein
LSCGQGRRSARSTVASRLLQFFCSPPKVVVNRTPDEFCHRSARLLGQLLQLLDLLLFEEEGCPFHGHIVSYRHTCVHRTKLPKMRSLSDKLVPIAQLFTSGCSVSHMLYVVNFSHLDGLFLRVYDQRLSLDPFSESRSRPEWQNAVSVSVMVLVTRFSAKSSVPG